MEKTNTSSKRIHQLSPSRMGRRSLMKALTTIGLGGISAATITADDIKAAASDEVPITYAMEASDWAGSSYEPQKIMVPVDWFDDVQQAHQAHEDFDFGRIPGIVGTTVLPAKFGGRNSIIQVEIAPDIAKRHGKSIAEARSMVPETILGVDTRIVESSHPEFGCYEHEYGTEPPVGCHVEGTNSQGTLGCPLIKDGNWYFSTNYHLFTDQNDPTGASLTEWGGDTIGEVVDYDCADDFVACEPRNGHSPTRTIVGTDHYILGYYTASGIDSLAANDEQATKRAVTTCETSGTIHGRGEAWAYDADCKRRFDQVKWGVSEQDFTDGDSGSVAYASPYASSEYREYALCINAARVPTDDPTGNYVFGTGAYHINSEYGYSF